MNEIAQVRQPYVQTLVSPTALLSDCSESWTRTKESSSTSRDGARIYKTTMVGGVQYVYSLTDTTIYRTCFIFYLVSTLAMVRLDRNPLITSNITVMTVRLLSSVRAS